MLFWKLPHLICKNDEALRKAGVLACRFDTPYCTYITKIFIEIPPCAKKVIFSTEFVLLDLNPHFYEVNQEV